MNTLRKIAACVATWLIAAHPALALNDTIGVTAGAGKTANLIAFGGGNVISEVGICDATTANQCASVSAGGALAVTGTITAVTAITNALPAGTNVIGHIIADTGSTTAVTGTVTVGGTVTANAGTNLNTSLLALEAGGNLAAIKTDTDRLLSSATNITAGSALATTSFVIGTRFLSAPPTFTNGQEGAFQIDANGRMLVTANATLGAETTKVIGTVRNLGNAGQTVDFAGQNASPPSNSWLVGAQFNSTPTTVGNGNVSPLQMDSAGNLLVNIKAGAGSGGTALEDAAPYTLGVTNMTPVGCTFNSGSLTLTSGTAGALSCTAGRSLHATVDTVTNWAGGALGAMANYGTSPGAVLVPGVNAFVTNATALGQAAMAASSPVVIANNQSNLPVVNGGSRYQHVAASQTAAVLQSSTGAIGDYLSHCVIYPSTTAAASVTVFDNTNAAGTNVIEFSTGTLSNLVPIVIPVGAVSTSGAWKVTTGANETVVCYGKFS